MLDIFEDQLDIGRLTIMADAATLLEQQLANLNRAILRTGGSVKASVARKHAQDQYGIFRERLKAIRHEEADRRLAALRAAEKSITKKK